MTGRPQARAEQRPAPSTTGWVVPGMAVEPEAAAAASGAAELSAPVESAAPSAAAEALRQQMLLAALWQPAQVAPLRGWLREAAAAADRGLLAYRLNGWAVAERALAAAHPTLAQMLGDDNLAALARAHWRQHPPEQGDLACWGGGLADDLQAVVDSGQPADLAALLADHPWLPDVARLDWAVHRGESAADGPAWPDGLPPGLHRLAGVDAAWARLRFEPALALLPSAWPLATLWQGHRALAAGPGAAGAGAGDEAGADADADGGDEADVHPDTEADPLAAARQALADGRAEVVLAWRQGWRMQVRALPEADAAFMRALGQGRSLGDALDDAGDGFDMAAWLAEALAQRWIAEVLPADGAAGRSTDPPTDVPSGPETEPTTDSTTDCATDPTTDPTTDGLPRPQAMPGAGTHHR